MSKSRRYELEEQGEEAQIQAERSEGDDQSKSSP
jgi:hypothetical protein